MRRDPTEFRQRFLAYKEGKMPYENGLPKYDTGKVPDASFSDDEAMDYILRLENPNRIGFTNGIWRPPTDARKYDVHLIGGGLDMREEHNPIVYNFLKSKGRLNNPYLTELEEKDLRLQTWNQKKHLMNKFVLQYGDSISQLGYDTVAAMLWHGHPFKVMNIPTTITGKALAQAIENGDRDLSSVFNAYYGYGTNATRFASRVNADSNYRKAYRSSLPIDVNKSLLVLQLEALPEFKYWQNYHQPNYSFDNPAPESISSWNNPTGPAYTGSALQARRTNNNIGKIILDPALSGNDVGDILIDNLSKTVFGGKKLGFKNGKLPKYEDGDLPELYLYGISLSDIPGPLTLLNNIVNSAIHPKQTVERIMRQSADGTRTPEDVFKAVVLNHGGDYTGHEGGLIHNRDLVDLYLHGNSKGFKKIKPSDNIGHSYDDEIIASGRHPKDINTYYGSFPVKKGPIILPKYAEQKIRALAQSGIPITKQLEESAPVEGADDVARFLATLSQKDGQPVISYSDMWDFMPGEYANKYGENFLHYMQAYVADKVGTPFILRLNVPIKFSDENLQHIFSGSLDDPDLETQLLLRAGIFPEVNIYPEPKILTPKLIKERKAKLEAAFLKLMKEMSTWKDGKLPYYSDGKSIYIKPANRGKFTALKKRTGHSASWFKLNGTPAQKKMAVFELNSRHWRH